MKEYVGIDVSKEETSFWVLDIVLPGGMNGVEIAEEAKRLQPGIKFLFTSGYAGNSLIRRIYSLLFCEISL